MSISLDLQLKLFLALVQELMHEQETKYLNVAILRMKISINWSDLRKARLLNLLKI